MVDKVLFQSKNDEWSTPVDLFAELDAEFDFDLDPCATAGNRKCHRFFTKEVDGLKQNWGGVECSAILRTARSTNGSKNAIERELRTTQSLFYLYHHGRTQDIFTTSFCTGQKSGSLKAD